MLETAFLRAETCSLYSTSLASCFNTLYGAICTKLLFVWQGAVYDYRQAAWPGTYPSYYGPAMHWTSLTVLCSLFVVSLNWRVLFLWYKNSVFLQYRRIICLSIAWSIDCRSLYLCAVILNNKASSIMEPMHLCLVWHVHNIFWYIFNDYVTEQLLWRCKQTLVYNNFAWPIITRNFEAKFFIAVLHSWCSWILAILLL